MIAERELRYGVFLDEGCPLDPPNVDGLTNGEQALQVYDTLLVRRVSDGTLQPALAESWHLAENGCDWVFHLRKDVHFQDGTPLNAEAVKFNLDRAMRMAEDRPVPYVYMPTLFGPYRSCDVLDEWTLQVNFDEPHATFPDVVCHVSTGIASPTAIQKYGDIDYWEHQAGSGPFIAEYYQSGEYQTFVRNPNYRWAPLALFEHPGPAWFERIRYLFIPDGDERVDRLLAGDLDYIDHIPPARVRELEANPSFVVYRAPCGGQAGAQINVEMPPTDELAVRQALLYGTKRPAIVEEVFHGVQEVAWGVLRRETLYYNPAVETMYPYDLGKAERLLEEAGWVRGPDGVRVKDGNRLSLVFIWRDKVGARESCELATRGWKELIGIETELKHVNDFREWFGIMDSGEYNLVMTDSRDYDPDPTIRMKFISEGAGKPGSYTYSRLRDEELDRLAIAGRREMDGERRREIYYRIQEIIMEEATVLPVYSSAFIRASRVDLQGIRFHFQGWSYLHDAWFA